MTLLSFLKSEFLLAPHVLGPGCGLPRDFPAGRNSLLTSWAPRLRFLGGKQPDALADQCGCGVRGSCSSVSGGGIGFWD